MERRGYEEFYSTASLPIFSSFFFSYFARDSDARIDRSRADKATVSASAEGNPTPAK